MNTIYDESFLFISIIHGNDDVVIKRSISNEFLVMPFFICPFFQWQFFTFAKPILDLAWLVESTIEKRLESPLRFRRLF
jgi:hypothetical protein